ncbi:hypothetical protein GCM10008018_72360 [Paenibacillus marchantiophytorum]|uniref:Uncharacterized protein n=1 Tax=Paenibacillus marchantiophytorum TaxID=1619310 RepID=A0ABQ1FJ71_9BACL|nr:hypothetical protein GCM10008018_72360 [Paenibacillus marchantiophytorum]
MGKNLSLWALKIRLQVRSPTFSQYLINIYRGIYMEDEIFIIEDFSEKVELMRFYYKAIG